MHRMRTILALAATAAAGALAVPGIAGAATVKRDFSADGQRAYITYTAAPGEDNDLRVFQSGNTIVFDDVVQVAATGCSVGTPSDPNGTTGATCAADKLEGMFTFVEDGINEMDSSVNVTTLTTAAPASRNRFSGGQATDLL